MKTFITTILCLFVSLSISASEAIDFDGYNDHINCGHMSELTGANQFTVETWVYFQVVGTWREVWYQGDRYWKNRNISLELNSDGRLYLFNRNGGNYFGYTSPYTITAGQWYHLAYVLDGTKTGNSNRLKLYINGVDIPLSYYSTIPAITNPSMTQPFVLGANSMGSQVMNGMLDEFRVWTSARTSAEINEYMNREIPPTHPDLLAYYRLNEGIGGANNGGVTTAKDMTGNYDGTLKNFSLNGSSSNWLSPGAGIEESLIIGGDTDFCAGGSASLEVMSSWAVSYLWSDNSTKKIMNATGPGTYSVVVTDALGGTVEKEVEVMERDSPVADTSNNEPCPGDDELRLTASGGKSYTWTGPGGFTSNKQNPTIPGPTPELYGIYEVIVTNEYGCTAIGQTDVAISENFNFDMDNATVTETVTGSIVFAIELCGGQLPYTHALTSSSGFVSVQQLPSSNANCRILQVTYTNTSDWTVTFTDSNDCSNDNAKISKDDITVGGYDLLVIDNFTTVKETGIGKLDGEITVNVSGGDDSCDDYTYAWSGPSTNLTNTDGTTGNTLTGLGAGTYNLTVTDCAGNTVVGQIILSRAAARGGRGRGGKTSLDNSTEYSLQLFPNPASDFVRINYSTQQTNEMTIQITDLTGRTVWRQNIAEEASLDIALDTFSNGIYIVSLYNENKVIANKKLLITK